MSANGDMVHALAALVTRPGAEPLSPATLDKVRLHALDTIGAIFAGAQTAEGVASRAPFVRMASPTNRPIALSSPASAAAVLSLSCRLTEADDIHLGSSTTPGSVVYAVLLAMTQLTTVSGEAAAEAAVAGYDVMTALGVAANGAEVVYGEIWPTYLAAAITAAAVAAKLMQLSEQQTAAALAIAATMTTGIAGRIPRDPTSRWVTLGCAVQNGLIAAASAEAGLHGDCGILERLGQTFSATRLNDHLAANGSPAIERVSLKPYCTGRQSLAAVEAFVALRREQDIDIGAIERVHVFVPPQYRAMIDRPGRPKTKMESRGVRYQLGIAVFYPDDLFDIDRPRLRTDDAELCRFVDTIEVKDSKSYGELYPRSWPGGVAIYARGTTLERGLVHSKGDPECPLLPDDVASKLQSISRHCGNAIPVSELSSATQALDFSRSMALLSDRHELWR